MYCGIELLDWEVLAVVRVTSTPPTRWALVCLGADWARMTEGGVGTTGSTGSAGVGGWSVEVWADWQSGDAAGSPRRLSV